MTSKSDERHDEKVRQRDNNRQRQEKKNDSQFKRDRLLTHLNNQAAESRRQARIDFKSKPKAELDEAIEMINGEALKKKLRVWSDWRDGKI